MKALIKQFRSDSSIFVVVIVCLIIAVRILPVWQTNFPLNDGGLFYTMVQDIQIHHFSLPVFTTYNHFQIPFAYPPFGLYAVAVFNYIFGWDTIQIIRWLPSVFSVLTVAAFYLWARNFNLPSASWATIIFAFIPTSFKWQVMGGGVTRGLGFLFAILTISFAYSLYHTFNRQSFFLTALFSSLTVLSHPEATWFLIYSLTLFWLFQKHRLLNLKYSLYLVLIALIMTSPWWLTVVTRHGWAPFISALGTGGKWLAGLYLATTLDWELESLISILSVIGLLGIFFQIARGRWLLPAWTLTILLLDARSASRFLTIPIALAAAIFLTRVILPSLKPLRHPFSIWLVIYIFIAAASLAWSVNPILVSLSPDDRAAIHWVAQHSQPDSHWLVMPSAPSDHWSVDRLTEWFPALTNRTNITTVQGAEWLPNEFYRRIRNYKAAKICNNQESGCLDQWSKFTGLKYNYVYVPKVEPACCSLLEYSLKHNPKYHLVYDGPAAAIFSL